MTDTSNTALYATQGGGYATYRHGQYVWHSEIPDFLPSAQVGDPIPDEWSVVSINEAAHRDVNDVRFYDGYDAMTDYELS